MVVVYDDRERVRERRLLLVSVAVDAMTGQNFFCRVFLLFSRTAAWDSIPYSLFVAQAQSTFRGILVSRL